RLPRSRWSGDEHEAARALGEAADHRGQPEIAEALDTLGGEAEDGRDRAALFEYVAAEARDAADAEREVELERLLEPLLLLVGEHAVGERLRLGRAQRRQVEPLHCPRPPDLR